MGKADAYLWREPFIFDTTLRNKKEPASIRCKLLFTIGSSYLVDRCGASCGLANRDNLVSTLRQFSIQIISPPLHHLSTLWQVLRVIVCGFHLVIIRVRKLQFDVSLFKAILRKNGTRQTTEAMPSHYAFVPDFL